jgi:hypothetical protein
MFPTNQNQATTGDRRKRLRFPLNTEVRFQFSGPDQRHPTQGRGKVENISSSGLAFRTDAPPKVRSRLAVSLVWPVKLDNRIMLRLVFEGVVLRVSGGLVVVSIGRPEFRTARKEQHGRP